MGLRPTPDFFLKTKFMKTMSEGKTMKNIILHFQNTQTEKKTVVTLTNEQVKQFDINGMTTKWQTQHGQSLPVSVLTGFDLVAEKVHGVDTDEHLNMIVVVDEHERKQYTIDEELSVQQKELVDGSLTLHYTAELPTRPRRDMYR